MEYQKTTNNLSRASKTVLLASMAALFTSLSAGPGCDGQESTTAGAAGAGAAGGTGATGGSGASGGTGASGGSGGSGGTPPWCEGGNVIAASSCEQADVQSAIDSAAPGDTVQIPAGTCDWISAVTVDKGITLEGAGEDKTVIVAAFADGVLDIVGTGGAFRLTGVGITGDLTGTAISIDGEFSALRMDHVKLTNIHDLTILIGYETWFTDSPAVVALFDHITYENDEEYGFLRTYGKDASWEMPDAAGTANAIFIEDSHFTWNVPSPGAGAHVNDGEHGARIVIRHTTITNGQLQWHDTGSTQQARGTRIVELYNNTFECTVDDCGWGAIGLRGGTGVAFDNTIPIYPGGYENGAVTQIYRVGEPGGAPWQNLCDGTIERICSTFRSHCDGGDHRSCGVFDECSGIGSCVDECSSDADCPAGSICLESLDGQLDSSGWPCRDQTGRGQDDPATHEQASSPFYWWNNIDQNGELATVTVADVNAEQIKANRDYYEQGASFDGSKGVGRGPLADLPTPCTQGTAYFAVDDGQLYQCSAAGAWAVHYKPYTYPHPLQASCQ